MKMEISFTPLIVQISHSDLPEVQDTLKVKATLNKQTKHAIPIHSARKRDGILICMLYNMDNPPNMTLSDRSHTQKAI